MVDDDPDVLTLLRYRLEQLQYDVSTAVTGSEGLAKLGGDAALALVDLRLPDTNGLEVLKQIRQTSPDTTVVVMTASPMTHARTLIDFSPSASSGFHRPTARSATGGPLRVRALTDVSRRCATHVN